MNSSGSAPPPMDGEANIREWAKQHAKQGAVKYYGFDAARLQVCTKKLASIHYQGCQICMEKFKENDLVRLLPCMHMFHGGTNESGVEECIDKWIMSKSK